MPRIPFETSFQRERYFLIESILFVVEFAISLVVIATSNPPFPTYANAIERRHLVDIYRCVMS